MREVHLFEFVVELDEEVDDCFCEIDVLEVVRRVGHGLEEVHHLYYRLNNYPSVKSKVLFLLHDRDLDGLDHPQNPVLPLYSSAFVLDQLRLVFGFWGNGNIDCLPSLLDY